MGTPHTDPPTGTWTRTPVLRWLCTASFVDQGVFLFIYLIGIVMAFFFQRMPVEEFEQLIRQSQALLLGPEDAERMAPMTALLRTHGVVLFVVLALRTAARLIGTLRMWNGHPDGLHIYILAQLLGVLAPMLVVGPELFNFFGLLMALNWCYLYWSLRKGFRGAVE